MYLNNALLRHLGYLYLAFAHLSDGELLPAEMAEAKAQINKYIDPDSGTDAEALMDDVIHWYNDSADTRLKVINSIAVTFNFDIQEKEIKKSILEDLVAIGKADDDFIEAEKEFIRVLSNTWKIEFVL